MYPFVRGLSADGGYQGPPCHSAVAAMIPQRDVETRKRSDPAKRFEMLPKRRVVERTLAGLDALHRHAKDIANLTRNASPSRLSLC